MSESTLDYLPKAKELLEAGADPNIVLRGHHISGKFTPFLAHKLMSARTGAPFLEQRRLIREDVADYRLQQLQIAQGSKEVDELFAYLRIPLVDAAYLGDWQIIDLLTRFGAHFKTSVDPVPRTYWSKLRNPFVETVLKRDLGFLNRLLKVATPCNALILQWLGESLTALWKTHNYDDEMSIRTAREVLGIGIDHHHLEFPQQLSQPVAELCVLNSIKHDKYGTTPLHIAVGEVTADVARYLIANGAEVNAEDAFGMSPLLEAIYYGHAAAIKLLLISTGDLMHRAGGTQGKYLQPLTSETQAGSWQLWRGKRNEAARLFQLNKWTALHVAAHRGFITFLELLMDQGAVITSRDARGFTALDVAVQSSNFDAAFALLARGCPFDAKGATGSRMMTLAIDSCKFDRAHALVNLEVPLPCSDSVRVRQTTGMIERLPNLDVEVAPQVRTEVLTSLSSLFSQKVGDFLCHMCVQITNGEDLALDPQSSSPTCRLCRLVHDCQPLEEAYEPTRLKYIDDGPGAPGIRLTTTCGGTSHSHPVRRIPSKQFFPTIRCRPQSVPAVLAEACVSFS